MSHIKLRHSTHRRAALAAVAWSFIVFAHAVAGQSVKSPKAAEQTTQFAKCWDYAASPDLSVAVSADAGSAYFLTTESKLEAVDLKTAAKVWSSELGGGVVSNLLVTEHAVVLVTSTINGEPQESRIRSVSKQTGIPSWTADLPYSDRFALGRINGNVVAVGFNGVVSSYSAERGELAWTKQLGVQVATEPQFTNTDVIFGTDRSDVIAVAAADGQVVSISRSERVPTSIFLDAERRLMIGDERGNLFLKAADGSTIWKFRNGARIAFVLAYDSEYIAGSSDNFVYKLTRGGNVEWKRRLSGRVARAPEIIGSVAVTSVVGDGSVFVLSLKNGKILNRIESADETSPRIAIHTGGSGFVVTRLNGLSYYARESCHPVKQKNGA